MMYDLCKTHSIPHRNTGKWIVAQDAVQIEALNKIHAFASTAGVPTRFLSKQEAQDREPDVRADAGVLESSSTGIVDSHALMQFLEGTFEDAGGICAFHSPVTHVEAIDGGRGGWAVTTKEANGEEATITADSIVNSAGLYAVGISNMILPKERHREAFYAKGTYFSYSLSRPRPSTLIYPAPVPGHGTYQTTLHMPTQIH
jgi:2-hydroxyglutarate dehydrogenase